MSALDSLEFSPLLITDVFESMKASTAWCDKSKLQNDGTAIFPFVSRTRGSNGIDGFCARQVKDPEGGCAVTIGLDTQTVAYQPVPFYTGQNIQVLRHPSLDVFSGLVLVTLIRQQMGKFSWGGNGATLGRLRKTRIMVPVTSGPDSSHTIDWAGMTRLGEELHRRAVQRSLVVRRLPGTHDRTLPELAFEPMFVIDVLGRQAGLFHAHKGKRLITAHRVRGKTPFVAGSKVNNSIVDYADLAPRFPAGWLTLIYNGDGGTGHAKYQPTAFSASDDVIVLEPVSEDASEDALMLMVTLLTHQCVPKFGFGYKLTLHRLQRQKIMVPVTVDADGRKVVDWKGMTAYGRALRARAERGMTAVLEPEEA